MLCVLRGRVQITPAVLRRRQGQVELGPSRRRDVEAMHVLWGCSKAAGVHAQLSHTSIISAMPQPPSTFVLSGFIVLTCIPLVRSAVDCLILISLCACSSVQLFGRTSGTRLYLLTKSCGTQDVHSYHVHGSNCTLSCLRAKPPHKGVPPASGRSNPHGLQFCDLSLDCRRNTTTSYQLRPSTSAIVRGLSAVFANTDLTENIKRDLHRNGRHSSTNTLSTPISSSTLFPVCTPSSACLIH